MLEQPPELAQAPVTSPCINICRMDRSSGLCLGCARSLPEISAWSQASNTERQRIKALLPQRRAQWGWPEEGPGFES